MNELLNTINNIKNNGILTPINIFTKKDENKIIKKILNSNKFKEIYPNTDKEKALSIIKCNFGLLASKEENNNYNHEFLVYDNGGSKEIFLYFEGSRARKWSLENEIIEVQETKTYKDIDNSIVQAATKENKNSLGSENMNTKRGINNKRYFKATNPGHKDFIVIDKDNATIKHLEGSKVWKTEEKDIIKNLGHKDADAYIKHLKKFNYIEVKEDIKEEFYFNNDNKNKVEIIAKYDNKTLCKEGNFYFINKLDYVDMKGTKEKLIKELKRWSTEVGI